MTEPRAVMERMIAMFKSGEFALLDHTVDAAYVDHQDASLERGPGVFRRVVTRVRERFPDLSVAIEDMIQEGDKVSAHLVWTGTKASGRTFQAESFDMLRLVDGKAVEHWGISQGWPRRE